MPTPRTEGRKAQDEREQDPTGVDEEHPFFCPDCVTDVGVLLPDPLPRDAKMESISSSS